MPPNEREESMSLSGAQTLVFVGTLTPETGTHFAGAHGEGIVSLEMNPNSGAMTQRHVFRELRSPSYLLCSPARRRLFAVECTLQGPGRVASLNFDPTGRLTLTGCQKTCGTTGCHLWRSPATRSASPAMWTRLSMCIPMPMGHSACPLHARIPRRGAEWSSPAGGACSPRRGRSRRQAPVCLRSGIRLYLDPRASRRRACASYPSSKSTRRIGFRHLVFHPTLLVVYVVCELSGAVLMYAVSKFGDELGLISETPGLPETWNGQAAASAIRVHPHGKALYVSQRIIIL